MKKKIQIVAILLFFASLSYLFLPYNAEIKEGFRNHRRRHWYNYLPWADGYGRRRRYYYNSYHNPWYNPWSVHSYYPTWMYMNEPRIFGKYNWFDYSNCPSGCAADSTSPSGFRCTPNSSGLSCVSDSDCNGCTVPFVPVVY